MSIFMTEREEGYSFVDKIAHDACGGDADLRASAGLSAVESYLDSEEGQLFWETVTEEFKEGVFMWLDDTRRELN